MDEALDDGARQVLVVGAGYDSRAWRLARPGVTYFEVDQPATQEDKRAKAPEGGPVYVSADVADAQLDEKLLEAGFQTEEPAETGWTMRSLLGEWDLEQGAPQPDEAGRQAQHLVVRGRRAEVGLRLIGVSLNDA